jgi:type I restriction enzyme R subunit
LLIKTYSFTFTNPNHIFMAASNFSFLEDEFPILFNIGSAAELYLHKAPEVTLIKLRQFGEFLSSYLFEKHELAFPFDDTFHNRLKELTFAKILPPTVRDLLFTIKDKGNQAAHANLGTIQDAQNMLSAAFKISKWFYTTYASGFEKVMEIIFHAPPDEDIEKEFSLLEEKFNELQDKFNSLIADRKTDGLPEEQQSIIREKSERAVRKIDMSEAETRELIDAQLRLAGWETDSILINNKSRKVKPERGRNMAIAEWPVGNLWVDYALFIGTAFYGIVEAKRYGLDISTDLRQSKIYAGYATGSEECRPLGEWQGYKVPFLFSTNGRPYLEQIKTKSGIWFLDIREIHNTSRPLQGWPSPDGLVKLMEQDIAAANQKLDTWSLDFLSSKSGLNLRKYQLDAIRSVEDILVNAPERKRALLAMATGTGKTRTIIGLCYQLIKANRFNRILFLVDRTLLGIQANNAFNDNRVIDLNTFADVYDVKGFKDLVPDADTRLHFATVQGMVKRLFYNDTQNVPTVDSYDCIIIDEAHRGYLLDRELDEQDLEFKDQRDYVSKYRMVLDYFDAFAVGLTATPALQTSEIFGAPIYTYSYRDAVIDGFLIDHDPPYIIQTKLNQEGIKWERGERPKAFDKENNTVIELAELQDELNIDVSGFNKSVLSESFNRTVVEQLVGKLDPEDEEKTLIFAATDEHADTIVQLLKEAFQSKGIDVSDDAIQKITGKSYNPEEQVKRFKNEKYPTIAVTVDLLTTGIDVPAISNIVFLRRVKSRILYEQMLGRATRLCDEIGKKIFKIYDAVGIYDALEDYTQMQPVVVNAKTSFQQLTIEFEHINAEDRARKQIEQILAKLQRKQRMMGLDELETFRYYTGGEGPDELIAILKAEPTSGGISRILALTQLWPFLDELKLTPSSMLISDHADEFRAMERGYGQGRKPEDYLENFTHFIATNRNTINALNIICTRPKELDRKSLRELMIILDRQGYNVTTLKAAWKATKNQDIAADIISFIRTLAVGNALISHEDRIKQALAKVRALHPWSKVQEKWINRFEMQLLKETVIQPQDLDESPFDDAGGFQKLDKIFENRLREVIETINENLYNQSA